MISTPKEESDSGKGDCSALGWGYGAEWCGGGECSRLSNRGTVVSRSRRIRPPIVGLYLDSSFQSQLSLKRREHQEFESDSSPVLVRSYSTSSNLRIPLEKIHTNKSFQEGLTSSLQAPAQHYAAIRGRVGVEPEPKCDVLGACSRDDVLLPPLWSRAGAVILDSRLCRVEWIGLVSMPDDSHPITPAPSLPASPTPPSSGTTSITSLPYPICPAHCPEIQHINASA